MSWSRSISRRAFLRAGTFSAGMLALSQLRLAPAVAASTSAGGALHVLTPREAEILTALAARITETGAADMPKFADTGALRTIDTALLQLDEDLREQFRWALTLFEYAPFFFDFHLSRFTGLTPEQQDEHIRGWRDSRFHLRRLAFRAVKNLAFLGYYSQDATWKGIHYTGPWAPRPRRVVAL